MIRHIVMWSLKKEFSQQQKEESALRIKEELEALKDKIDDVLSIEVIINTLPTGNADVVLNSTFENEQALANYQVHPEHLRAATFVRSVVCERMCADYPVSL